MKQTFKVLSFTIFLILVFIASVYAAYYFENNYTQMIRFAYASLSQGDISFSNPGICFHFASTRFAGAFGIYGVTLLISMINLSHTDKVIVLSASILSFALATIIFCYADASLKLAACIACPDGKLMLHYNEVNYDVIFGTTLFVALLPALLINFFSMQHIKHFNYSGSLSAYQKKNKPGRSFNAGKTILTDGNKQ